MQIDPALLQNCWFLAGPTATGKTPAGIALAQRIGGEIVALDSMTIYRGMDIGTAKPTTVERAAVPHHLLDIRAPHEDFSVGEFIEIADRSCREILSRDRIPLLVGGTGLYLRAVLRGVFDGPAADWEYRKTLETVSRESGAAALHEQLRQIDPPTAARLPAPDVRRVIRALEIHHVTGRPASQLQQQTPLPVEQRPRHVYWLHPPRDWLRDRVDRRVEQMFAAGLVEEVRELSATPLGMSRTAQQALGYKEVLELLAGQCTQPQAVETLQRRTRQFAKRQHTWFRNLVECREIAITGDESPEQIADLVIAESHRDHA